MKKNQKKSNNTKTFQKKKKPKKTLPSSSPPPPPPKTEVKVSMVPPEIISSFNEVDETKPTLLDSISDLESIASIYIEILPQSFINNPSSHNNLSDIRFSDVYSKRYFTALRNINNELESLDGIKSIFSHFQDEFESSSSSTPTTFSSHSASSFLVDCFVKNPANKKLRFLYDVSITRPFQQFQSSSSSQSVFSQSEPEKRLLNTLIAWYLNFRLTTLCKNITLISNSPFQPSISNAPYLQDLYLLGYQFVFHIVSNNDTINTIALNNIDLITPIVEIGSKIYTSFGEKPAEFIHFVSTMVLCHLAHPIFHPVIFKTLSSDLSSLTHPNNHAFMRKWLNLFYSPNDSKKYANVSRSPGSPGLFELFRRLRVVSSLLPASSIESSNAVITKMNVCNDIKTQIKTIFFDINSPSYIPIMLEAFIKSKQNCDNLMQAIKKGTYITMDGFLKSDIVVLLEEGLKTSNHAVS